MRIDPQIPTSPAARPAPAETGTPATRVDDLEGYRALLDLLGASAVSGPEGVAGTGLDAVTAREMNDPLGLASRQAAVTPSSSPLTDNRFDSRFEPTSEAPATPMPHHDRTGDGTRPARSSAYAATADAAGRDSTPSAADPGAPRLAPSADQTQRVPSSAIPVAPAPGVHGANGTNSLASSGTGVRSVGAVGSPAATGQQAGQHAGQQGGANTGQQAPPGSLPGLALAGNSRADLAKLGTASFAQQARNLRTEQAEIAPQVAKGLASLVLRDGGRATIQLRPEALGRVEVDLSIRDGVVNATMSADNETARDLLNSELDRLRTLLEQRGLRVERLEIVSDRDGAEAQHATEQGRGGRWMPAQDEPHGFGRDAGTGSPGSGGDDQRARGGAPWPSAERGRPDTDAGTAEAGVLRDDGAHAVIGGRRPAGLWVRLDTVA